MTSISVPPHSSSRRAALLEKLIVALTTEPNPLPIRTRAPDDPTIALLDAWATVGDVLGFYLDRIADEGYLSTAIQPGSILALAGLVGYQPAPGLAAQVYLAYTLAPDPADGAVQFNPGLLFQSVPSPGQQPQTFESAQPVVARPSWNVMAPKSGQPLQPSTTSLVVDSTTANLSPNDVILLAAGANQHPALVASATVDYTAKVTNVTLQKPADGSPAPTPAPASPPPPSTTAALDALLTGGLGKQRTPVPESANHLLPQTAQKVFAPGADTVPRLISTLQPAVAAGLYTALGSTTIGAPPVTGASVMQVTAAPFGAAAPPQPVFNASGQPAGSRDWPIGDTFTLQLSVTATDFLHWYTTAFPQAALTPTHRVLSRLMAREHAAEPTTAGAVIDVQWSVATFTSQATIAVPNSGSSGPVPPTPPYFGSVTLTTGATTQLTCESGPPSTTPSPPPPKTPELQVTASLTDPNAVALTLVSDSTDLGTLTWDPAVDTPFSAQLGATQVTIAWATPPGGEPVLTFSIITPLPLADPTLLLLDGNYPGIVAGSAVVITNASTSSSTVATVASADTVAASSCGITGKVTQLKLDRAWIDPADVLQSALRPLAIHAQPATLPLRPAPVTTDVSGASIDLDGLVAGMQRGRLIALTGTRTDLPAGSTIQSGEIAMIASVATNGDPGGTPYSTLNLANPLAYSYQRATVQIYGNVVRAHQGATLTQVLGSGQPAQAPQSFTLASGPLLADPTSTGVRSSLTVTVNGVGYTQVDRVDSSTPAQSFLTRANASGHTTIVFPAPLPAGTGNISASYRAGDGRQGNLKAAQITQLLSRPPSLSGVVNPLPASGGTGGDDQESVRAAAPASLAALGQVVTVGDYAAVAKSIAQVGKASAALAPGGVVVAVAGTDPVQLDRANPLCATVAATLTAVTDPTLPVQVLPANLYLIALTADVVRDPSVSWDATVAAVQAALLAGFGYPQRNLGQDVAVSDLLAATHQAVGVLSCTITGLALIPAAASASDLASTLPSLLASKPPAVATLAAVPGQWPGTPVPAAPAAVAYFSATAPGTLILTEQAP